MHIAEYLSGRIVSGFATIGRRSAAYGCQGLISIQAIGRSPRTSVAVLEIERIDGSTWLILAEHHHN